MAFATLTLLALAAPAQAQKQEYPSWVYDEMVPTGPYMQHMDEAQPIPEPKASRPWTFQKTDPNQKADPKANPRGGSGAPNRGYASTNSLAPPKRDAGSTIASRNNDLTLTKPRDINVGAEVRSRTDVSPVNR